MKIAPGWILCAGWVAAALLGAPEAVYPLRDLAACAEDNVNRALCDAPAGEPLSSAPSYHHDGGRHLSNDPIEVPKGQCANIVAPAPLRPRETAPTQIVMSLKQGLQSTCTFGGAATSGLGMSSGSTARPTAARAARACKSQTLPAPRTDRLAFLTALCSTSWLLRPGPAVRSPSLLHASEGGSEVSVCGAERTSIGPPTAEGSFSPSPRACGTSPASCENTPSRQTSSTCACQRTGSMLNT